MANFDSGVSGYLKATATVVVNFPIDYRGVVDVRCELCRFYYRYERECIITREKLNSPSKGVGGLCPLCEEED